MKTSFKTLLLVATFAAFTATSCSQKTEENAEATTESAANDAAANADAAGSAAQDAVTADGDGQNTVVPEQGDTAVVRNQPAEKMVEETPNN